MSKNLKENKDFLLFLRKASPAQRQSLINKSNSKQLSAITECAVNVCAGNVKLTPRQYLALKRNKRKIHRLITTKTRRGRQLILQKGGFLPVLLSTVLPIITGLIQSRIRKS